MRKSIKSIIKKSLYQRTACSGAAPASVAVSAPDAVLFLHCDDVVSQKVSAVHGRHFAEYPPFLCSAVIPLIRDSPHISSYKFLTPYVYYHIPYYTTTL